MVFGDHQTYGDVSPSTATSSPVLTLKSIQYLPKKCSISLCKRLSVSRGLCRGHGGGRRCFIAGCNKSAQSRSDFCWRHGGGQRCDVPHCQRSRKSNQHFCTKHLSREPIRTAPITSPSNSYSIDFDVQPNDYWSKPYQDHKATHDEPHMEMRVLLQAPRSKLPSLRQVLQTALPPASLPVAIYRRGSEWTSSTKQYRIG